MNHDIELTIVSPVYNNGSTTYSFVKAIKEAVRQQDNTIELILVDDGSTDDSAEIIQSVCKEESWIRGLYLSSNMGQSNAIKAGIEVSHGNYLISIDSDLQQNPSFIHPVYTELKSGSDIVFTISEKRMHSSQKNSLSYFYFALLRFLMWTNHPYYKMTSLIGMSKKTVNEYLQKHKRASHFGILLSTLNFSKSFVRIEMEKRSYGKSTYTFIRSLIYGWKGLIFHTAPYWWRSAGMFVLLFFIALVLEVVAAHIADSVLFWLVIGVLLSILVLAFLFISIMIGQLIYLFSKNKK